MFLISTEIYNYYIHFNIERKNTVSKIPEMERDTVLIDEKEFMKFEETNSFLRDMKPGYIYTDENFNLFCISNDNTFNIEKDKIYKIETPFKLKHIKINDSNIIYYYNAINNSK